MSRQGIILGCICLSDLLGTAIGIKLGWLKEFNALLNSYLEHWGLAGFIVGKLFLVVVPILVFEISLRHRLDLCPNIKKYYKITIFTYVFIFAGSIVLQIIIAA